MSAQFQLELAQRFDDVGFEIRRGGGVTFHAAVGQTSQLFDHFVEASGAQTGRAPLPPQVLRFAQTFADLGGELAIVAPAVAYRTPLWSKTIAAAVAASTLCAARLLAALLLTVLRTLLLAGLSLLTFATALPLLPLLALLAFLALLSLLLSALIALLLALSITLLIALLITLLIALLLTVATLIQTATERVEVVGKLACAVEIFFGARTVRAARALLCCLKAFGNVVETALERAFVVASRSALLTALLAAVQRLFTLANAVRNAIAR